MKSVTFTGVNVALAGKNTAAVVGYSVNTKFSDIAVHGTIAGSKCASITGVLESDNKNIDCEMTNCSSDATISATPVAGLTRMIVGGLVQQVALKGVGTYAEGTKTGYNDAKAFNGCSFTGTINVDAKNFVPDTTLWLWVGQLFGGTSHDNANGATSHLNYVITDCTTDGTVNVTNLAEAAITAGTKLCFTGNVNGGAEQTFCKTANGGTMNPDLVKYGRILETYGVKIVTGDVTKEYEFSSSGYKEVGSADALTAAITAAVAGDVIKLTSDITLAAGIETSVNGLTLDGNSKTITFGEGFAPVYESRGLVFQGKGITIKDLTIASGSVPYPLAIHRFGEGEYATATLTNVTVNSTGKTALDIACVDSLVLNNVTATPGTGFGMVLDAVNDISGTGSNIPSVSIHNKWGAITNVNLAGLGVTRVVVEDFSQTAPEGTTYTYDIGDTANKGDMTDWAIFNATNSTSKTFKTGTVTGLDGLTAANTTGTNPRAYKVTFATEAAISEQLRLAMIEKVSAVLPSTEGDPFFSGIGFNADSGTGVMELTLTTKSTNASTKLSEISGTGFMAILDAFFAANTDLRSLVGTADAELATQGSHVPATMKAAILTELGKQLTVTGDTTMTGLAAKAPANFTLNCKTQNNFSYTLTLTLDFEVAAE